MKPPASSVPRRDPAPPRVDRRTSLARRLDDVALFAAGATMAIAAVVFAYAMLTQNDPRPHINGMQYLAIFSQPRGAPRPVGTAAPSAPESTRVAANGLDQTPTGAIGRDAPDKTPTGAIARLAADKTPTAAAAAPIVDESATGAIGPRNDVALATPSYRIVAAEPGMAWLSDGTQIRALKPGDVAPGLPRIGAITRRDGRWALTDESGAVVLMSDGSQRNGPGSRDDPFARRMIFSSGD